MMNSTLLWVEIFYKGAIFLDMLFSHSLPGRFGFFFSNIFLLHPYENQSREARMGPNFDDYPGFQPKKGTISASFTFLIKAAPSAYTVNNYSHSLVTL